MTDVTLQNYPVPTLPQLTGGDQVFWRNELQKISKSINLLVKQQTTVTGEVNTILSHLQWTSFSPAATAWVPAGGSISVTSQGGDYIQIGPLVVALYVINAKGSAVRPGATPLVQFNLPINLGSVGDVYISGRENAVSGVGLTGVSNGATQGILAAVDGQTPFSGTANVTVNTFNFMVVYSSV